MFLVKETEEKSSFSGKNGTGTTSICVVLGTFVVTSGPKFEILLSALNVLGSFPSSVYMKNLLKKFLLRIGL